MAWLGMGMPKPTYYGDAPRGEWPSQQALGMARQYDQAYGSTAAGFVDPNIATSMRQPRTLMDYRAAAATLSRPRSEPEYPEARLIPGQPAVPASKGRRAIPAIPERVEVKDPYDRFGRPTPMSLARKDALNEGYVASQYSALSALGFDPRRISMGEPGEPDLQNIDILGAYQAQKKGDPAWDKIISTGERVYALPHESIHRGMVKLRDADRLPASVVDYIREGTPDDIDRDEYVTRAMMLKNFGGVEKGNPAQVARGKELLQNPETARMLNELETAAAEMYARDTPDGSYKRGPR